MAGIKTFMKPSLAISWAKDELCYHGYTVKTEKWQGISAPDDMWETLNISFQFFMPDTVEELAKEVEPNLPWADEHFDERVGGIPYNPPPSHVNWPFAQKNNKQFGGETKFSHTYPERIWPKYAGNDKSNKINHGIRFDYGDFNDIINLLNKEPYTRQAFLPMWFPEDTGVVHNERVPCSLGWHFIRRDNNFHVIYYIRSCDYRRHFRDDIYMAARKLLYVLDKLKKQSPENWGNVKPGYFTMHITSLHCFNKEKEFLKQSKK